MIESSRINTAGWDATAPVIAPPGSPGDERNNPAYALGGTDGFFFSLGQGGRAIFGFDTLFFEPANVFEVTFGCSVTGDVCGNHPEEADVYGLHSFDPVADDINAIDLNTLTQLGTVGNAAASGAGGATVTFPGTYAYLLLHDISTSPDGFDVDAVSVNPIPLPAGLVLLLSGLAGIGFLGRYKAKRREPAVA